MNVAPLQFLLLVLIGWANRRQLDVLEYLKEENRILREQLRGARGQLFLPAVVDYFCRCRRPGLMPSAATTRRLG